MALTEPGIRTGMDIWMQPLHGDRSARPFLATPSNERVAVFSPDGRWIAYTSDETGRTEVYVRAFPGPGGQWLVSRSNNTTPETLIGWRADGKELYYCEPTGGAPLMAVSVETSADAFTAQPPHALFTAPRNVTVYPVATRDGSRFVAFLESDATTPTRGLDLTLNWVEELKGSRASKIDRGLVPARSSDYWGSHGDESKSDEVPRCPHGHSAVSCASCRHAGAPSPSASRSMTERPTIIPMTNTACPRISP